MRVAAARRWVALPLTGPVVRAVRWGPLLAVAAIVPAVALLFRLTDGPLRLELAIALLRGCGLLLGAAGPLLLADEMAGSTASVPTPRWLRQWLRTLLALGYAGLAWAGTYGWVAILAADGKLPLSATLLPAVGCVLLAMAGSALVVRRVPHRHGAATGGAVLALLFAASLVAPPGWSPWPDPTVTWSHVHTGWVVTCLLAAIVTGAAHRDTR